MNTPKLQFLSSVLDSIELKENKLLVWGLVDGALQEDELSNLILPQIETQEDYLEVGDVIYELLNLNWIVKVVSSSQDILYRSRMSETVRLLQRLRQLFPKHEKQKNRWQQAPTLVADFRFQRKKRQYPKRDITGEEVTKSLKEVIHNASLLSSIESLLRSNGSGMLLSGFQVRATQRILRSIESKEFNSTIVCAGTGSGKTLAFYLPSLSYIASLHLSGDSDNWVKTISLYPRIELLKDQLREVISRVISLREVVPNAKIRVGAFYGDTPKSRESCKWDKIGDDFRCPSLRCIKCNGEMRWLSRDYLLGQERLECADCRWEIDSSIFPLTRSSLTESPPDILFTTTEMLNQRLSDNSCFHLFGVGPNAVHPPELVLIDEVHTYEGRYGAQVAYMLRRWSCLVESPLRYVGLSATLREAPTFFSSLTGAWLNQIEEISPRPDEIEFEGAEYMLALRGDPVSRSSLLSTTIQTTMLMQRCLDPKAKSNSASISCGAFGQRTFVFTDNLDVTNRLFFGLLDAEGRNSRGIPVMEKLPLASIRSPDTSITRYLGGQDWRMCEAIGNKLSRKLDIKRVSSQDRGVDPDADVVVATAVLEVGFDDPTIGAVIQHKAPRSIASFLQRKGRSGRFRGMRPWTSVVLSDYGRDRVAYQSYDLLFDPELPAKTLPLSNRYIIKMQAVFATIDFLGKRLRGVEGGSIWEDLSGPVKSKSRKTRILKEIKAILEQENVSKSLTYYLCKALKLHKDEIEALLWEFPRPLMTMVLPTALRRVDTDWKAYQGKGEDFLIKNNPLPEFIPPTLFSDLNMSEVSIELTGRTNNYSESKQNSMNVLSALREFSPGRVSHRFSIRSHNERYWIPPTDDALKGITPTNINLSTHGSFTFIGSYSFLKNGTRVELPVYRPRIFKPTIPSKNISDTSNSRLAWSSQFVPKGKPIWLEPPIGSIWCNLTPRLGFFTHAHQSPIEIRRFTSGAMAEIGIGSGENLNLEMKFTLEDRAIGLGFSYEADGIVFQISLPDNLLNFTNNSEQSRAIRTIKYYDLLRQGKVLTKIINPFLREWIGHVYLSAVAYEAIQQQLNLQEASRNVCFGRSQLKISEVLGMIFLSQGSQAGEVNEFSSQDKLKQDLEDLLSDPSVIQQMDEHSRILWEPITTEWKEWMGSIYQSTLGAAILKTMGDLCSTINLDELSLDLDRGSHEQEDLAPISEGILEIWITENSPGGSGLVEEFMRSYSADPRNFFSMISANLEMGEFEQIDSQLIKLLSLLTNNNASSDTKKLINQFRSASSHSDSITIFQKIRLCLLSEGLAPFHGFLVSIGNRILRPGASDLSDNFINNSIQFWCNEEVRLGVEIDLRVISFWFSQSNEIDKIVVGTPVIDCRDQIAWRMNAIYGLLWGRGKSIRQAPLQVHNQFQELPPVERLIVINMLRDDRERVWVGDSDWLEKTSALLARGRLVTLTCEIIRRELLGTALHALITNPIETGYLRSFARLQGVRQSAETIEADLELLEAVQ